MNAPWALDHFRPVAPVGKKFCATCTKPMNARDNHARCQSCRNSGGYLALKYRAECPACGKWYTKPRASSKACSISCGQKVRRMDERERRAGG